MRSRLNDALKDAMKAKDTRTLSTIRLILAALKDRDIAARSKGNQDGISDDDILGMLQAMIKQRHDSIEMYEKGGRMELAEQEANEIEIIRKFLPAQMTDDDIDAAVTDAIAEAEATSLKEMGKVMALLKEKYAGSMDFSAASARVKDKLAG